MCEWPGGPLETCEEIFSFRPLIFIHQPLCILPRVAPDISCTNGPLGGGTVFPHSYVYFDWEPTF
jgi:hypothetical protein